MEWIDAQGKYAGTQVAVVYRTRDDAGVEVRESQALMTSDFLYAVGQSPGLYDVLLQVRNVNDRGTKLLSSAANRLAEEAAVLENISRLLTKK